MHYLFFLLLLFFCKHACGTIIFLFFFKLQEDIAELKRQKKKKTLFTLIPALTLSRPLRSRSLFFSSSSPLFLPNVF